MRLELDARTRRLMRRWPVSTFYSVAELALLAGLAVQIARLVWAVVTPVGPLGDWRPAEPAVPGSPAALLASFDPFFRASGQATGPASVTALRLKLYGVRIDEAMGRGSAIVAGPDGVQQSVAVGEEVMPGVRLKAVAYDHVTLVRGGRAEDLYLDQSGAAPTPPTPGPPAAAVPAGPPTLAQLRQAMVASPRLDGGRLTGLVLAPQGPAFNAAGLRQGDVVTAINGRPVTGLGDLERAAVDLKGGGTLQLQVERGGATTAVSIPVAPGA